MMFLVKKRLDTQCKTESTKKKEHYIKGLGGWFDITEISKDPSQTDQFRE